MRDVRNGPGIPNNEQYPPKTERKYLQNILLVCLKSRGQRRAAKKFYKAMFGLEDHIGAAVTIPAHRTPPDASDGA